MDESKINIARALMDQDTRPRGAIPEEDWYQMQFAPIKVRKGEWDWGVPGMIQEPYDAWKREWDSARGIGEGVTQDQQLEDALMIAGLATSGGLRGGGLRGAAGAARPAGAAEVKAATMADDIPFTDMEEVVPGSRLSAQEQAMTQAKTSGYWPDWGDQHPQRAMAHVKDMQASADWEAIVRNIQFPEGARAMDRWQAEKIAMEQAPDVGRAMQDARLGWLEQDKGRSLQPSEMTWHGLNEPPGAEPLPAPDLWEAVVQRRFDAPGSKSGIIGGRRVGDPSSSQVQSIARALLDKK